MDKDQNNTEQETPASEGTTGSEQSRQGAPAPEGQQAFAGWPWGAPPVWPAYAMPGSFPYGQAPNAYGPMPMGFCPPGFYPPPGYGMDPRGFQFQPWPGQQAFYGPPPGMNPGEAKPGQDAAGKTFTPEDMEAMVRQYGQLHELIQNAAKGEPDIPAFLDFFQTTGTDFWKGAVIGTILTVLATSDSARNALGSVLAGLWNAAASKMNVAENPDETGEKTEQKEANHG